jgi:hypothetical protein
MKLNIYLILIIFTIPFTLRSQEKENHWIKKDSLYKYVQPSASMQLWSTYTMGEEAQLTSNGPLEPVQDRLNFFIRRARIGFKGKPYKRLSYVLSIQYDNVGKDKFSGVRGSTNTGTLGILDAYMGWKITNNDLATVTFGYLHPQISRECITGDMLVNAFDKSPSQGYIRQHITGKGYGRATGVNIGGLKKKDLISFNYNVGIFNNNTTGDKIAESSGKYWSPLLASRVTFSIGDSDIKTYAINYNANNFFNNRKGITIGFNASHQSKTDIFRTNQAVGIDLLLNYSKLNFDAELFWLKRNVKGNETEMRTGHVRLGYNMIIANKVFLEPTVSYVSLEGHGNTQFKGSDNYYDCGINWYLNKQNYKMSLHYVIQNGNGNNTVTDEKTFSKGNYLGYGLVVVF